MIALPTTYHQMNANARCSSAGFWKMVHKLQRPMDDGWLRRAIEAKRDGETLDAATWTRIIEAYVRGDVDDAPIAALAMACTIRGMADEEIIALTDAMIRSGDVLVFSSDRIAVDKHSSGGVGDTVSLVVVPLVAACGVPVAKLSGRALGHTGGTLDKLEAIPGVRTDISPHDFIAQVERIGCAIAAQSERLVPADRKLYALRDRTGTVPSVGLIAASIVSKKIASGAGAIVFDVKAGGGAFMRTRADALVLAELLVRLAHGCGRRASAVVTDMDEPLAANIGTGAEAVEARDFLRGDMRDERLAELTAVIAHEMLRVGGIPEDEIAMRYDRALASGAAYEKFVEMLEAQGGSRASIERIALAAERTAVAAPADGFVSAIDAIAIGEAARDLVAAGGPFAGIRIEARVGARVRRGDTLAQIAGPAGGLARVAAAFTIAPVMPAARSLVEAVVRDAAAPAASKSGKS
jgi:pyrimidine-nucleoside phosphorylase